TSVRTPPFFRAPSGEFTCENRGRESKPATTFRQLQYSLRLSNLQPIRSPSGPLRQKASDLGVRKALASIAPHIFSRPKLICNRFYGFQIGDRLVFQSFRHTHTVSTDHALD